MKTIEKMEDLATFNQLLNENDETLKGIRIWDTYRQALPLLERCIADSKTRGIVTETICVIGAYVKGKEILHLPQALEIIERIKRCIDDDLVRRECEKCQREMIENFLALERDEKVICETQRFTHQWFKDQGLNSGHIANLFFEASEEVT